MKRIKVKSVKLKVNDEIKGENVRLISFPIGPKANQDLDLRPDRGRLPYQWVVGPCRAALYKQGGGTRLGSRGSPQPAAPTNTPTDLGCAAAAGSATATSPVTGLHCASLPCAELHQPNPRWPAAPLLPPLGVKVPQFPLSHTRHSPGTPSLSCLSLEPD